MISFIFATITFILVVVVMLERYLPTNIKDSKFLYGTMAFLSFLTMISTLLYMSNVPKSQMMCGESYKVQVHGQGYYRAKCIVDFHPTIQGKPANQNEEGLK